MMLLGIVAEACDEKITAAGGLEQWNSLSKEEQEEKDAEAYAQIIMHLGEDAYDALSAEDQHAVDLFIHAGCCMHKELNTCKGGNAHMMAWWAKAKVTGPVKLMNRDNAAAAAAGSSTAKKRAADVSGAGGVKATSLAGAIFNNKDSKKGQQETLQAFLVLEIGYTISFPDTSNIHYHSHCNAATELIINLPLYLKFLEMVCDKKESGSFNHMDQNLNRALQEIPTLTELVVLCLYSISVCIPYMKQVRGDTTASALDLGPLHDDVKAHCKAIINAPGLLLDAEASNVTGALFGELWERPEAFYTVHALKPMLPHLC